MLRQISLKTKKLQEQGVRRLTRHQPQDGTSNVDHVDTAAETLKADATVENHDCSAPADLDKMRSKDPGQRWNDSTSAAAEALMVPALKPQAVTKWDHVKERRKTVLSEREYTCQVTIDTDTVHRNLELSDCSRKVAAVREEQLFPDRPQRFDVFLQLLCSTGLTGCHYWDFEWRGWVEVSVTYAEIGRKGSSNDCRFGFNAQSWVLECSDPSSGPGQGYSVRHDGRRTELPSRLVSGRAAVFVDCPAGTVSFYEVSPDALIPLHTFSTTFTGPLYPGFGLLSPGSSVSL